MFLPHFIEVAESIIHCYMLLNIKESPSIQFVRIISIAMRVIAPSNPRKLDILILTDNFFFQ